ncbi:MAG TPA: DUF1329 domain-containing protein [Candidatus Binataceae bacterium]|nr:DUF1329 domain-containing protein [Candidatus Binataceae bacterium]
MDRVTATRGRLVAFFIALGSVALMLATPAVAQVKPGDVITPDNAAKVKDLVSPGVYWRVQNGMTMKIVPTERIDWPPPYKEATEKYSPQVRLTSDHRSLVGYVAGQPFPLLDPNDPDVATKIMWNYFFRPVSTDDYDLRFFDCESVYSGLHKPYKVLWYYSVGHYAGYNEVGRTEVEPMPVDPDFLVSGRYSMTGLYPQLAPEDGHGAGFMRYRYADPNRADDAWTYLPAAHRLRRLNDSLMSTAQDAGPESYSPDDFECFAGKNENYNWKYLGEREMLGCINDPQEPPPTCPTDGGGSHCPANWEMRHMYIMEGTARPSRLAGDLYSKHLLYIDSEADFGMYQDQYDRRGQLFINYTSWLKYADRVRPDSRVAIYPFKRLFQSGSSSTDVQSGLSTVCYHPGYDVPEKECWYINMGAVDRSFFNTDAIMKASQR